MPGTIFRVVTEHSSMRNNDEWVRYISNRDLSSPEAVDAYGKELWEQSTSPLFKKRLVICRAVAPEEVAEGLDPTFRGSALDEKIPELTRLLDSLFRLSEHFRFVRRFWQEDQQIPSKVIAEYAASNFYDCMSGGCPFNDLAILRKLCDLPNINLDEEVYPTHGEKWHTLRDFMAEIDKRDFVKDFEATWTKYESLFRKSLPASDWKLLGVNNETA